MIHHIVHLGDLHLRSDARNDQRRAALDQVIQQAQQRDDIAAWVWPGDLNDRRMSIEDRNFLAIRLRTMANQAPVLLVYGNHDLPGDLDIFAELATVYPIRVVSRPDVVRVPTATEIDLMVFCLPYPTKGALVAAGMQGDDLLQYGNHALDHIFLGAAGELAAARREGTPTLMIGHINVGGSVASAGQPQIGRELELDPAMLARLGDCPKLLNHIHKGQALHGAWYAGSMCRLSWGEVEDKHALLLGFGPTSWAGFGHDGPEDTDGAWAWDLTTLPIDVPPMYHVEGTLDGAAFDYTVTTGPDRGTIEEPPSWDGTEVRVRYRFPASARALIDDQVIRGVFEGAARLVLEPVAVPDEALRAPEVAAATTLEEKVAAWARVVGEPLTDGVATKLDRLQQLDGPALLTEVSQGLNADDRLATREVA